MATIQYKLSSKKDKNSGKSEILLRFFHGSVDQRGKTNIFVDSEHWSEKSQRLVIPKVRLMSEESKRMIQDLSEQNRKLEALREFINQSFIEAGAGKVPISKTWLNDRLNEYNFAENDSPSSVLDALQRFINIYSFGESRKNHFKVLWRAFKRFLIFNGYGTNMKLDDMTSDTIREFIQYLKKEHTYYTIEEDPEGKKQIKYLNSKFKTAFTKVPESRLPEPRGQNAINTFLVQMKTFILWAIDEDYTDNNPFKKFEIPASVYGTPYYITIEERNHLYSFDFSYSPRLAVQRDIFVFQSVIGCRVSDLKKMTKASVINGAIEYIPRKTKDGNPVTVRVPLNTVALEIIERYKDIPGESLLPCISDQRYNDAIKDIFKAAGLDRMVTILNPTTREDEKRPLYEVASSHLARRTFIGNLYKQVQDPNLIGKLSGHVEGSRAFARYRDIDEDMMKELVTMLE